MKITSKTIEALKLLIGTSHLDTISARVLAERLWPDRVKNCNTSLRRGGLYRSAGAYYSKLQKTGLVGHWVDDYSRGYYITKAGINILAELTKNKEGGGV